MAWHSALHGIFTILFIFSNRFESSLAFSDSSGDLEDRLTQIAEKVDLIDKKLVRLTGDEGVESLLRAIEGKLDGIDAKLDILLRTGVGEEEKGVVKGGNNTGEGDKGTRGGAEVEKGEEREEETSPDVNIVDLLTLERTPSAEGNRFTLRFRKNPDTELFYRYHDGVGPGKTLDSAVEEGQGVWSVNFTVNRNLTTMEVSPWFVIGDKSFEEDEETIAQNNMIGLRLNNSKTGHKVQEMYTLPVLHVTPTKDAPYVPGQDLNVTAYMQLDNNTWGPLPDSIFTSFSGVDLDTGKYYMNYPRDALLQINEKEETAEELKASLTLKTSSAHVSGYLNVMAMTNQIEDGDALVGMLQISKFIRVRPSSQTGSLPPHYMGMVEVPGEKSKNGNELKRCSVGAECPEFCYAVGNDIHRISVVQLLPDGTKRDVPSAKENIMSETAFASVYWTFKAEEYSGDSDGITTFECRVHSDSGRWMTKHVDVIATMEGSIDEDKSSMEVANGPMNPYTKNITLRCAVKGRPIPSVAFSGGSSADYEDLYDSPPDQVINVGDHEAIAIKVTSIDDYFLRIHRDDIKDGRGEGPSCYFHSSQSGKFVKHVFEIPEF